MPGTEELRQEFAANRDYLLKNIVQASERAKLGLANEVKAKTVDSELQKLELARTALRECSSHMTSIYKNIEHYANERKQLAEARLKDAIACAGDVVPDADIRGFELKTEAESAKVVNRLGQDINLREGGAYRATMGVLLRRTIMSAQPDCIQAMFLDESMSTLSDETVATLKDYLDVMKDDTLIVGIEQRGHTYDGLKCKTYRAIKGVDKVTEIVEE